MRSDSFPPEALTKTKQIQRLIQSMDPLDFRDLVKAICEASTTSEATNPREAVAVANLLADFAAGARP